MRVGIYNRYWTTHGGGERYVGTIVEALKDRAEVDVIGVEPLDLGDLGVRLELDFSGARFVRWPDIPCSRLTPLTRAYDILINGTYGSSMRSEAGRSVYVVLFPHRVPSSLGASLQRLVRGLALTVTPWRILPVAGFYEVEPSGLCWTSPDAWLRISPRAFQGGTATLRLRPGPAPAQIVSVSGPIASWSASPDELRVVVDAVPARPIDINVRTEPFIPRDLGLNNDTRQLGLCFDLGRDGSASGGANGRGSLLAPGGRDFLQDYDTLLSISAYTQQWVRRRWGRESVVVPPPVDTERFHAPSLDGKRPIILSVGRFFAAQGGHNKKHIEMLRVFREMCDRGLVPADWEFYLAGHVHRERPEHISYFEEVRRLAEGYPVRILADLPYDRLVEAYRAASVFWHAAGWGEDDGLHPERFEHFGITTCEAMSAGCIPVVIAKAGQAEIVTDGVNGYTFLTGEELSRKTLALMEGFGTSHNTTLALAAREASERYNKRAFSDAVRGVLLGANGTEGP